MKVLGLSVIALAAAASASAIEQSNVSGTWSAADGSASVRISPCVAKPDRLCATVISDKPKSGERSWVGEIALSDIVADGPNRWKAQYHDRDQVLPATLRLRGADLVDIRVCVAFICSTDQYRRTPQ